MWDPMGVEQMLENLLSNAFKFDAGKTGGSSSPIGFRLGVPGNLRPRHRHLDGATGAYLRPVEADGQPLPRERLRYRPVGDEPAGLGDGGNHRRVQPAGRGYNIHRHASPASTASGSGPATSRRPRIPRILQLRDTAAGQQHSPTGVQRKAVADEIQSDDDIHRPGDGSWHRGGGTDP